jgi:hypothetical protein
VNLPQNSQLGEMAFTRYHTCINRTVSIFSEVYYLILIFDGGSPNAFLKANEKWDKFSNPNSR